MPRRPASSFYCRFQADLAALSYLPSCLETIIATADGFIYIILSRHSSRDEHDPDPKRRRRKRKPHYILPRDTASQGSRRARSDDAWPRPLRRAPATNATSAAPGQASPASAPAADSGSLEAVPAYMACREYTKDEVHRDLLPYWPEPYRRTRWRLGRSISTRGDGRIRREENSAGLN